MPRFQVLGVDTASGMETSVVLDVATDNVARVMAKRRGIDVADVFDLDAPPPPPPVQVVHAGPVAPLRAPRRGEVVCPNPKCDYVGKPKRIRRGSIIILILLMFLFLLPAFIYAIACGGYKYKCPRCGMDLGRD